MIITLWTADPGWMLLFSVVHLCYTCVLKVKVIYSRFAQCACAANVNRWEVEREKKEKQNRTQIIARWWNMFLVRLLCCGSDQPPGPAVFQMFFFQVKMAQVDCPILHVHLPPSPLRWPSLQLLPQQRLPMKLSRSSKSHPSFMAPCLLSWASQQCKNGLFEVQKNPNQLNIYIKRTMWPKVVLQ